MMLSSGVGEENSQRYRRKSAPAPYIHDPRLRCKGADLGDGQRMKDMPQVQLPEILARDDVDAGVPQLVQRVQRRKLRALTLRKIGEISKQFFHRSS